MVDDAFHRRSETDFRVEWFSGSGAGGQHRNKHQNSARVTHLPTGIVETRQGRERNANLRDAKAALCKTLDNRAREQVAGQLAADRRAQVGSGQRGDKVLTLRFQDDRAAHENGRSTSATRFMRGFIDDLWS